MNTLKGYRISFAVICLPLMLALIGGSVKAGSQQQMDTDFAAVDAYVTGQMNNLGIPGLALGIVQDGQIAHLQGFGVADSSGKAVVPQTPFYLASLTKSFTALAVMQLVEAGKINLDAPVQTYLPWFKLGDIEASAKITVRNLLNQTTGISTADGDPNWLSQRGLEETVRGLGNLALTQPVGTAFQYSNINYGIAGLIVEVISGQSYADYVSEHIFEPLDMRHSFASPTPAQADGLVQGYSYMFGRTYPAEDLFPPAGLPSGGLIVSVEDMAHYAIAHLKEGRYGNTTILSPQGIAELHAAAVPSGGGNYYGMGWEVAVLDGTPFISHGGALRNARAQITLLPEKGLGIILLANAHGFEQLMQVPDIATGVINLLNGKPAAPVSLIFKVRFLYWAVLIVPLLMVAGMVYTWRRVRWTGAWTTVIVVLAYMSIAMLWLFGIPQLMGPPFSLGNRIFYPELAYGWMVGVVLGIGWSLIFTVMYLRSRITKKGS